MRKIHAAAAGGVGACVGVGLLAWLGKGSFSWRFVACVALALLWYGAYRFWQERDRRFLRCFGTLGALFMVALGLGLRLESAGETGLWGLLASLGLGVFTGPAAGFAAICLFRLLSGPLKRMSLRPKRVFWVVLGLILLCWLPVLIAYFPGITGYDMDFQMHQIRMGEYSAHHPLLHTLFIGACYRLGGALGNPSLGYGLHTLVQALLLAAAIAYAMAWLCKIRCPRAWWIALLMFFCLSPQHAIMAVSGTKDILFAAAMLAIAVELCRLLMEPERKRRWGVLAADALLIAVACMLRNNAAYGFLLLIALAFLFFRRKTGKRVLVLMLAGVVLAQGGMTGLKAATGAADGSVREMMSVPCQQLARVYDKYGLEIPVGYEIREVLPDFENYKSDRADFTKRSAKVTTPERMNRFIKLWLREAMYHPIEYIDAFLYLTKGFWYVDDFTFATTYDEVPGSPVGCMVLGHNAATGIDAPGMLAGVRELGHELFTLNGYRNFAVLWSLLHPALYTWLLGFVLAWAVYRRNSRMLLPALGLLCYLLTLLMGPCAIIRYQYYLMLAAPVLVGALSAKEQSAAAPNKRRLGEGL